MRRWPLFTGILVAALAAGCGDDDAPYAGSSVTPTTGPLCASGQICTVAGTGIAGDGADGLPARETRLYLPQDTTVGPDGLLYVVDWNNHRIRVIQSDGTMRIVAGAGELGLAADDPSTGRLNHPTNVTFDPMGSAGEMWIAAWHNSRVKKADLATGDLVDMCGTGKRGFGGNGGPAVGVIVGDSVNQAAERVADEIARVLSTVNPRSWPP